MFSIRTTTLCCLLLATQAADDRRPQQPGARQGHDWPLAKQGHQLSSGHGGADGDWRKEFVDQVGPDADNKDRGIGRPKATNLHRRGKVMSGTVESTCDYCKAVERGQPHWGKCRGFLCGNAQIVCDPRKTGETRPCLAFWNDAECPLKGVSRLHPLFPGCEVMFVVVPGAKAHQVKAIRVERNLDREFPEGTAQADINLYSNQQQALKTVDRPKHAQYDAVKIKALYSEIGKMTQHLLVEQSAIHERRQPPKVDVNFRESMKGVMAKAQEQVLDMDEVRKAVLQLIEELLLRSQNSSQRSSSPSASSDRSGTCGVSGELSPHQPASSSAPASGRNTKTPQAERGAATVLSGPALNPSATAYVPRRHGDLGQRARDAREKLQREAEAKAVAEAKAAPVKKASFSTHADFVVISQDDSPAVSPAPSVTIEEIIEPEIAPVPESPRSDSGASSDHTQD